MMRNLSIIILSVLCLFSLSNVGNAQGAKPIYYATRSKSIEAKFKAEAHDPLEIQGDASLVITAANDDDTLRGTLIFAFHEETRARLADVSGKRIKIIPLKILKKDVTVRLQKGTSCPVLHFVVPPTEMEMDGSKIELGRHVLSVHETPDQFPQLLCAWARQINTNRQRRGIIAAINRLINPEQ